jgi:hypothetical protein
MLSIFIFIVSSFPRRVGQLLIYHPVYLGIYCAFGRSGPRKKRTTTSPDDASRKEATGHGPD